MAHLAAAAVCEAFEKVPQARGRIPLFLCLAEDDRAGRPVRDHSNLLRRIGQIADIDQHSLCRVVAYGRSRRRVALDHARKLIGGERCLTS